MSNGIRIPHIAEGGADNGLELPVVENAVGISPVVDVKPTGAVADDISEVRELLHGTEPQAKPETVPSDQFAGTIVFTNSQNKTIEIPLREALIYVIDDHVPIAKAIARLLKSELFSNVKVFDDGQPALDAMRQGDEWIEVPHLMISDTNMKYVDGPELAEAIQAIEAARRPRFLPLTADTTPKNIATYQKLGYSFVGKPFDCKDLLSVVAQRLQEHPGFRPEKGPVKK